MPKKMWHNLLKGAGTTGYEISGESNAQVYHIRGTSTAQSETFSINGSSVVVPVVNGEFDYEYNKPLTSLIFNPGYSSYISNTTITSIDCTDADNFDGITNSATMCNRLTECIEIDFGNATFRNAGPSQFRGSGAYWGMFQYCSKLTTINMPLATFKGGTYMASVFDSCSKLTTLNVNDNTFKNGTTYQFIFLGCAELTEFPLLNSSYSNISFAGAFQSSGVIDIDITLPDTTNNMQSIFDNCQNIETAVIRGTLNSVSNLTYAFSRCPNLRSIDFPDAEFNSLTHLGDYGGGATPMGMCFNDTSLTSISWPNATFSNVIYMDTLFQGCTSLESVDFSDKNFDNLQRANALFSGCSSLTDFDFGNNTFPSIKEIGAMFYGCVLLTELTLDYSFDNLTKIVYYSGGIAGGCTSLTSFSMPNATLDKVTEANSLFSGCLNLAHIDLSNATFANLTTASLMFQNCYSLTTLDLTNATFESLSNAGNMFSGCSSMTTLSMPNATFTSLSNASNMFIGCSAMTSLDLSNATFESVTMNTNMFYCTALTDITCYQNTFPISTTFAFSPLTYQSINNVANWLKNLQGETTQTVTFKASAWNTLTSAEQNSIDSILTAKNWTRVLA